jgi:hypothetical protein
LRCPDPWTGIRSHQVAAQVGSTLTPRGLRGVGAFLPEDGLVWGTAGRGYADAVDIESLGYRTDLMVRAIEGSQVTDRGGYIAVRTAANPGFYWGNFLLLPAEALSGPPDRWLSLFASEFPEAKHVALGFDVADGDRADVGQFEAAGLTVMRDTVLMTTAPVEPSRPGPSADLDEGGEVDEPFVRSRFAARRAIADAGHGVWFGASETANWPPSSACSPTGPGLPAIRTSPLIRARAARNWLRRWSATPAGTPSMS